MSSRCILHSFNRLLSDPQTAHHFRPELPQLVNHICKHVETAAAEFNRPIDEKIKKVLGLPHTLQTFMFNLVALPGYDSYVLTRKVMIDKQISDAIAAGCEQFIILGSGFDPGAALRAINNEGLTFYAIDLATSQKIMMNALSDYNGINLLVKKNYHLINYNLEEGRMFQKLLERGFKAQTKTFLLMEGLTVYLDEATVSNLLQGFKQWCAAGSRALIGFTQKTISKQQVEAHEQAGESYKFMLPLVKIPEYLNELGLHIMSMFTSRSAIALNAGGWFFNYYYGSWLSNKPDEMGIDHSTPEPYFLIEQSDKPNKEGLPEEMYEEYPL